MNNEADQRTDAQRVIDKINTDLKKWETWFPDEMSSVEVPRKWLLALKAYAEIGLAVDDSDVVQIKGSTLELEHGYYLAKWGGSGSVMLMHGVNLLIASLTKGKLKAASIAFGFALPIDRVLDDEHVSCSVVCSSDKCKWRGRRNLRKFGPCPKCGGLLEESDLPPYSLAEEL